MCCLGFIGNLLLEQYTIVCVFEGVCVCVWRVGKIKPSDGMLAVEVGTTERQGAVLWGSQGPSPL